MTLPASGALSMNDVNVELGLSGTAQISLDDIGVRLMDGSRTGAVDLDTLHGKANQWKYDGNNFWEWLSGPSYLSIAYGGNWIVIYLYAYPNPTVYYSGTYYYYRGAYQSGDKWAVGRLAP